MNSIYGRSLLSNKNLHEIRFCRTRVEALEYIASPRLREFKILKPNLTLVMMNPKKIYHNKLIQAGFTVLEHAKRVFYEGYYDKLPQAFGNRLEAAYIDTDGLFGVLTDPNGTFFDDLARNAHLFDWSKLPHDLDIFDKYPHLRGLNEGQDGLWKLESINISEGVFLKAKQYSVKYFGDDLVLYELKCKGIPGVSLADKTLEDYKDVVLNKKVINVPVRAIRSIDHRLYNITVDKIAFHYLDINRVYPDANNLNYSLPFFHHRLDGCNCTD